MFNLIISSGRDKQHVKSTPGALMPGAGAMEVDKTGARTIIERNRNLSDREN